MGHVGNMSSYPPALPLSNDGAASKRLLFPANLPVALALVVGISLLIFGLVYAAGVGFVRRDIPATVRIGASIPGDVTGDGTVDIADLDLVAAHIVSGGVGGATDLNRDGKVNVLDLVIVGTNFHNDAGQ